MRLLLLNILRCIINMAKNAVHAGGLQQQQHLSMNFSKVVSLCGSGSTAMLVTRVLKYM